MHTLLGTAPHPLSILLLLQVLPEARSQASVRAHMPKSAWCKAYLRLPVLMRLQRDGFKRAAVVALWQVLTTCTMPLHRQPEKGLRTGLCHFQEHAI